MKAASVARRAFVGLALGSLASITGAEAQNTVGPARVGLIDLSLTRDAFRSVPSVSVRQMTFYASGFREARLQFRESTVPHADTMAKALVDAFQQAAPGVELMLHVATPIMEDADRRQVIDLDQLGFAFDWFASQGVYLVATTFVGHDSPDLRGAMERAQTHGLIILASAGNGELGRIDGKPRRPFPAAYPGVLGISTTALAEELTAEDAALKQSGVAQGRNAYVAYSVLAPAISPMRLRREPELGAQFGSSRATTVAAGILAALSVGRPLRTTEDARRALDAIAAQPGPFEWGAGVIDPAALARHERHDPDTAVPDPVQAL